MLIQDSSISELIFELQSRTPAGVLVMSMPHEHVQWEVRKTSWGDPAARLGLAQSAVKWELDNIIDAPSGVIEEAQETQP